MRSAVRSAGELNAARPAYIDLGSYRNDEGQRGRSKFVVQLWWLVQHWLIHPSPQFMFGWRRFLWRLFGAKVGKGVRIRPSAKVTYPWKVSVGDESWIGDEVELYSLGAIEIGANTVVSQRSYLCAGAHDYLRLDFPLVTSPIRIEDQVWIAADCFIGPGVTIGCGSVIGARSLVLSDMPGGMLCFGNPAVPVKPRPVPRNS